MFLKSTNYTVEFDREVNNLISLKNLITGDDYVKTVPDSPIFRMIGLQSETMEKIELLPGIPDIEGNEKRQLINYRSFSGYNIKADLVFEACDDKILISGSIQNNEKDLDIIEILCPHISGIVLGGHYQDDSIIYPHHAGEMTLNPVDEYAAERTQSFWRAGSVRNGNVYAREINYCGLASMSWMYYFDSENGLYLGSHDPRFPVTGVIAESHAHISPYMGFNYRKHHRIGYGETYDIGTYVIAVSTRDWHYGAKIYREYMNQSIDINPAPEFLKEEYALNQCYNFKRRGTIEHYFKDIPGMFEEGMKWGVRHMFIASWNRTGFDSFYPEYYPDMELGSAMELRRGLSYVREHGGFTTLYINARIFDMKSDYHGPVGEKMALRNHKGEPYYETYGPERFTVNCPSDELWREYLLDTAEFTVKAYGADGIYLDQLASAEPFACYCNEHSHTNIEEFNNGYVSILKELLARLTKDNPNAYIMTENCGDIYGSYTWGNLTWNGAFYDEYYNVFKYTFPEFVQVNMVNPRAGIEGEEQKLWFLKDMQRAILLGNILWLGITTRLIEASGDYHIYAKQALSFRKELQRYLSAGKFLDHSYISEITENCDATCWLLPNDEFMFLCGNYSNKEHAEIRINLPHKAASLTKYDINWSNREIQLTGNNIILDIGNGRLWCFLVK